LRGKLSKSWETPVKILWLGKRFYTNKDALREHFGRMYRIPVRWQQTRQRVRLWLVDYHTRETVSEVDAGMEIVAAPVFGFESIRQVLSTLVTSRPRCVVASGDCYLGLLGWTLARMSGAVFVFDVYDKYDEFDGYRKVCGFDLFAFLLRRADRLTFASRGLAKQIGAELSVPVRVVANGVDSTVFGPRDMRASRCDLGLPDDILFIGYFGGMEPDRGVADLIDAIGRMRAIGIVVELLLAGKAVPDLSLDAPWIRYLGMVPHKQMPTLLCACDVVVVPYRLSPFMDMGASCKIAEYLACRRPLVATATPNFLNNFPAQAAMMGDALCQPSDPDDMARALAYQLKMHAIPPAADDMTWDVIADGALQWIRESHTGAVATSTCGESDRGSK
jgi:glycosyltransferase involved in cell wall biosynthesis